MILILLRNVINKFNAIDDNILIIKRICGLIREDNNVLYSMYNNISETTAHDYNKIYITLESIKAYCSKIKLDIDAIIDTKVSNRNKAKNSYTNSNMNTTSQKKRKSFNRKPKTAKVSNVPAKQ